MRKRWEKIEKFGKLGSWLTFHIFLCTLGPFYVLLHSTFKIGNVASISFWSMVIVVLSGIFGRYVYIHIPKSEAGIFLDDPSLLEDQVSVVMEIRNLTDLSVPEIENLIQEFRTESSKNFRDAIWKTIKFDATKKLLKRRMELHLRKMGIIASVRRETIPLLFRNARLEQQRRILEPFITLFGYWHVLHIPLTGVMFVTLAIHVGAAILFGYTWIF